MDLKMDVEDIVKIVKNVARAIVAVLDIFED